MSKEYSFADDANLPTSMSELINASNLLKYCANNEAWFWRNFIPILFCCKELISPHTGTLDMTY